MAVFRNHNANSSVESVEFFTGGSDRNTAFVRLKKHTNNADVKNWLESIGQNVADQAEVNGQTILMVTGGKKQNELVAAFKSHGDDLQPPPAKSSVNLWGLRGIGSMIGQPMQLISSYLQPKGLDTATMGFAASNMAANLINVFLGAQKLEDDHQLVHIKGEVNNILKPYLPPDKQPLSVKDDRSALRETEKPSMGEKAHDIAQRYSVTVGDIGLRFLGSVFLVTPATKLVKETGKYTAAHWKKGLNELSEMKYGNAWKTLKNNDRATLVAGLMYVAGKTLSLTSEVPDPYNKNKKHTWVDTIREKVVFPVASVIEGSAALVIAVDRLNLFKNPHGSIQPNIFKNADGSFNMRKISFDKIITKFKNPPRFLAEMKGRQTRDWIGGVGGLFFAGAQLLRFFAPFGVRTVDMAEVNAHVADSLAMLPPDKMKAATMETAAYLTEHFQDKKDKKMTFGQIYTSLANDLQQYHHITFTDSGVQSAAATDQAAKPQKSFSGAVTRKSDLAAAPPGSHIDRANARDNAQMSLGA